MPSSSNSCSSPSTKCTSESSQSSGTCSSTSSSQSKKCNCKTKTESCSSSSSPYNPIQVCCARGLRPPPQPMVFRPDRCCYEQVKGPFQKPIPTPYQRQIDKFKGKCCRPRRPNPSRYICFQPKPNPCCDNIRQFKACQAELQRLREERWKEQERKAIMEDKCRQEWMDQQYHHQVQEWERAQAKCDRDRERRKVLLKQILAHRKEMKQLKEESRQWRRHQQDLMLQQQQEQDENWVREFSQREDERRWEQERLKMIQENRLLNAQMRDRCSTNMAVPELEELRRMFVPVEQGPKETFEYFVLEPRPTDDEIRQEAEKKMQCLMGLRETHGMHLNVSDRGKKRTTIQVAMGPKHSSSGDRTQSCKVISTPGALCSECCGDDSTTPNVVIPQCLKPLMQTLSYRVNEIDTPLLSMKTFGQRGAGSNGKQVQLESGPNFNGTRLYGTIVLPKGKALSPFYTQPYNVTF